MLGHHVDHKLQMVELPLQPEAVTHRIHGKTVVATGCWEWIYGTVVTAICCETGCSRRCIYHTTFTSTLTKFVCVEDVGTLLLVTKDALYSLSSFFLFHFPAKFALVAPPWKQVWSNWDFNTLCRMVLVHGPLLSLVIWPTLLRLNY